MHLKISNGGTLQLIGSVMTEKNNKDEGIYKDRADLIDKNNIHG